MARATQSRLLDVAATSANADWMDRLLPNERRLLDVAVLPGTHNSGTCSGAANCLQNVVVWRWARCQGASVLEQLQMGVRVLDLRVALRENIDREIVITHTFTTSYTLRALLAECAAFLSAHPTEFIVVNVKCDWEYRTQWTEAASAALWQAFRSCGCNLPPAPLDLATCSVGDLRGMLVPAPRCHRCRVGSAECCGVINDERIHGNSTWESGSVAAAARELEKIVQLWESAPTDEAPRRLRELSVTVIKAPWTPLQMHGKVNALVTSRLKGAWEGKTLGMLLLDFVTPKTVELLVRQNAPTGAAAIAAAAAANGSCTNSQGVGG